MGEVYKATDTRLERTVAIKVLPAHVASDPERKSRFEREAKTVAGLSHPHICTVFDIGSENSTDFLVMEYLEGETLADRLAKGALPLKLDQALEYAIQIADALDKAHRQGVTHRDLKPANIMLTKAGAKLLDFGLAKLTPAAPDHHATTQTAEHLTRQGAILGTLPYMAPEQVEGRPADARSDIWAFGCVVYEMVTAEKAFKGKSQTSLIAAILDAQPPAPSTLQPNFPPALDRVISRCLAKEPDNRWQTACDLLSELKWIDDGGAGVSVGVAGESAEVWPWPPFRAGIIVASAVIFGVINVVSTPQLGEGTLALLSRLLEESRPTTNQPIWVDTEGNEEPLPLPVRSYDYPRLSPDGRRLAVCIHRDEGDEHDVWVFDVQTGAGLRLTREGDNREPTWTPDGERIIFSSTTDAPRPIDSSTTWFGNLFSKRADGSGATDRLTTSQDSQSVTTISPDGQALVFTNLLGRGVAEIWQVGTQGQRESRRLLQGGAFQQGNAAISPDGRWLAYRSNETSRFEVYVQRYPGAGRKIPISNDGGMAPAWSHDSRHLFFWAPRRGGVGNAPATGGLVMAVEIDPESGVPTAPPRAILDGNFHAGEGARQYDVAPDGRFLMLKPMELQTEATR